MNDIAVKQATGRTSATWFSVIRDSGKADCSHKEIADFLHDSHQLSYWWAQEITVEYERHTGRRLVGQTQDGLFQIGVSKTIDLPAADLWQLLQSPRGISLITSAPGETAGTDGTAAGSTGLQSLESLRGESRSGIRVLTTTFETGSHLRLRWQLPQWPSHSILQIRLTPKSDGRTTLSFHQEKLPSREERRMMGEHWRRVASLFAGMPSSGS
jgi:uncharacterized protein YndB with AHSA1/START domain